MDALMLSRRLVLKRQSQNGSSRPDLSHRLQTLFDDKSRARQIDGSCTVSVQGTFSWTVDFEKRTVSKHWGTDGNGASIVLTEAELDTLSHSTLDEVRDAVRAGRIEASGDINKVEEVFRLLQCSGR
jgi:hypothetical protein